MSDILTKRQGQILQVMVFNRSYSASDIQSALGSNAPSAATLRRDVVVLQERGLLAQSGAKRGTLYEKTLEGALRTPFDPTEYFKQEIEARQGLTQYAFDFVERVPSSLFSEPEKGILDTATLLYQKRNSASTEGVRNKELERLVIELSWKSSAIEGNTYTLLDTERLLTEGVEAEGHTTEEATMILNHKRAFSYVRELGKEVPLSKRIVENVHGFLVEGLGVAQGVRHGEVGVVGSGYRPLAIPAQIESEFQRLCEKVTTQTDVYSRALLALVGISYLQPFEDGNKRTARLVANALLLQDNKIPLSYRTTDAVNYRESMLTFYEQLSLVPMKKIFMEQYDFATKNYLA